jgi:energy-coupling factor transporter ATP-binding protein EcfA2
VLIRFEVENFRSIADPVELSMVAIDPDRDAARPVEGLGESLVTRAGLYGPNASGKSNVLAALAWLSDAVRDSLRAWDEEIPIEPFALGTTSGTTTFELDAFIDGVRHQYELELDAEQVHYERLSTFPAKRRRIVFEREDLGLTLSRGQGSSDGARELLTPTTLALSALSRLRHDVASQLPDWLKAATTAGVSLSRRRRLASGGLGRHYLVSLFDDPDDGRQVLVAQHEQRESEREQARALLRLADLGIKDVSVVKRAMDDRWGPDPGSERVVRSVELLHDTDGEPVPLPFTYESEGTRTWFGLIGTFLRALQRGGLLIIDELDASLHPTLAAEVLRIFADRDINPHGAQILFSSHDVSLLSHLNRDEVWLTEKRKNGATHLGPLSEFAGERVRKSQNLESAYLHGRFGAIPDVDQAPFLRALGLIG